MQKRSFTASRSGPSGSGLAHRRVLLGTVVLMVLVVCSGLLAYLTRDGRSASDHPAAGTSSSSSPVPGPTGSAQPGTHAYAPAGPPSTHDPIAFAKASAVALWSYDTRVSSQPELVASLHRWLAAEGQYSDADSVDRLVPSPLLWGRMADSGQFATATAAEAHFPDRFTKALQADPGAITQAYVYAVTVSGKQSISWNGAPQGGAEDRAVTVAVQCRPDRPCALAGVLPAVAP
ncbi:hypothetical protein [Kitasatospora sp. NPDC059599]|uniref:hypothetical protein n=1 Tax=Kitasatospora sp. NPDC059599 TaxID=3346880 RepID=UPI003695DAFD